MMELIAQVQFNVKVVIVTLWNIVEKVINSLNLSSLNTFLHDLAYFLCFYFKLQLVMIVILVLTAHLIIVIYSINAKQVNKLIKF